MIHPPVSAYEDDEGALDLAQKSQSSKRTKQIDVGSHFIRDLVKKDNVFIENIDT